MAHQWRGVIEEYRDFATYASGDSPCLEEWALGVAEDAEVRVIGPEHPWASRGGSSSKNAAAITIAPSSATPPEWLPTSIARGSGGAGSSCR